MTGLYYMNMECHVLSDLVCCYVGLEGRCVAIERCHEELCGLR